MYQLDPLYCLSDEKLLMDYVICDDAELLYLDAYDDIYSTARLTLNECEIYDNIFSDLTGYLDFFPLKI